MQPHTFSTVALFISAWGLPLAFAASWGFNDATISVHGKKAGVGGGEKQKYLKIALKCCLLRLTWPFSLVENKPLPDPITLGESDTLKILLTINEGKKASQPHQAFLLLREPRSNLDTSFPLSIKDSGKGKLELVCSIRWKLPSIVNMNVPRAKRTSQFNSCQDHRHQARHSSLPLLALRNPTGTMHLI